MDQPRKSIASSKQSAARIAGLSCAFLLVACLALPLLIYAGHGALILLPNRVSQLKWQNAHIQNYQITVRRSDFSRLDGQNVVTVHNEQVVENLHEGKPVYAKGPLEDGQQWSQENSVEAMFGRASACAFSFPWLNCRYRYDAAYGYPKVLVVACPIPDACYDSYTVMEFKEIEP